MCAEPDPLLLEFCSFASLIVGFFENVVLYQVRNGASDPFVGPLATEPGRSTSGVRSRRFATA